MRYLSSFTEGLGLAIWLFADVIESMKDEVDE
jgi:hypothetical protein